ncbi:hypothetical protein B0H13DRAFT_2277751 [Mycena leptocephala]|nr:hypothetical protein B0H13DRAFT_2277751 [Mycena leptocephala]
MGVSTRWSGWVPTNSPSRESDFSIKVRKLTITKALKNEHEEEGASSIMFPGGWRLTSDPSSGLLSRRGHPTEESESRKPNPRQSGEYGHIAALNPEKEEDKRPRDPFTRRIGAANTCKALNLKLFFAASNVFNVGSSVENGASVVIVFIRALGILTTFPARFEFGVYWTNLGVLQESNHFYEAGRNAIYREAKHTSHSPTTEESKDGPRNYLTCVAFKKDIIRCTPDLIHDGYSNEQRRKWRRGGYACGIETGIEREAAPFAKKRRRHGIEKRVPGTLNMVRRRRVSVRGSRESREKQGARREATGGDEKGIVWERRDLWRWPIREGTRGKEERNVVRRQKAQTGGGAMRRHPAHCVHGPDGEGGESGLERETRGMSERISTGARRMGRGGKQRTNTRDLYVEPYASQDRHGLVDRHGGRENSSRTCRAAHEGPGDAFGRLPQYNKPNLAWAGYHRQGNAKTHCAVGVLEGQTMVPRNKGQVFTALSRTKIAFVRNLHHGKLIGYMSVQELQLTQAYRIPRTVTLVRHLVPGFTIFLWLMAFDRLRTLI